MHVSSIMKKFLRLISVLLVLCCYNKATTSNILGYKIPDAMKNPQHTSATLASNYGWIRKYPLQTCMTRLMIKRINDTKTLLPNHKIVNF